jgi:hypothetical protein
MAKIVEIEPEDQVYENCKGEKKLGGRPPRLAGEVESIRACPMAGSIRHPSLFQIYVMV